MRIGVNALYLIPGGVGGTEIYLRSLLAALAEIDRANEYFIFTNRETGADLIPSQPNFKWRPQPVRARIRPVRIVWEQTGLPVAARRHGIQVMLNPGFTCPVWAGCPNVTVFHDLQHKRHPEYFRWFDLPFWRLMLWAAIRRSSRIIAVSQATREDLCRYYGVDSVVIHHGVEEEFFRIAERRQPQNYVLCVSTLHPHKNLERLIRVHAALADAPELVITGFRGFAADRLEKLAADKVRLTGWVTREQLYELYRGARAFIYPSTFEGFGMPVLEAMAAAVPVACSDIPPLREIADGCAVFFDPTDDEKLRIAMQSLLQGSDLVSAARARAREFSWGAAARATLKVLTECAVTRMKTGNKYDFVVKELFQRDRPSLLDELTGGVPVREILNVELARVEERRADLVLLLADGTLLHVEFQSSNDKDMPYRMGIYCLLLRPKYRRSVRQVVLYVGDAKMRT